MLEHVAPEYASRVGAAWVKRSGVLVTELRGDPSGRIRTRAQVGQHLALSDRIDFAVPIVLVLGAAEAYTAGCPESSVSS
jgi:hypothetical protein